MIPKIYCEVKIEYRDDKVEKFKCCDTPSSNPDWITIFPYEDPTARKWIPREAVKSVEYRWRAVDKS